MQHKQLLPGVQFDRPADKANGILGHLFICDPAENHMAWFRLELS